MMIINSSQEEASLLITAINQYACSHVHAILLLNYVCVNVYTYASNAPDLWLEILI